MHLPPMPWQQLYAIARDLLRADPSLPDSEWVARIKDEVVKRRKAYPHNDKITRVLRAVEQQHPRPPVFPERQPPRPPAPLTPQEIPLTKAEAQRCSEKLLRRFDASLPVKTMPEAREWEIDPLLALKRKALLLVMDEIEATEARCDALEAAGDVGRAETRKECGGNPSRARSADDAAARQQGEDPVEGRAETIQTGTRTDRS